MPCEWLKHEDGTVVHINRGRGGARQKCKFCNRGYISKLCDFPVGNGKTCDAGMCDGCTTTTGRQDTPIGGGFKRLNDTIDVCPIHRNQKVPDAVS